MAAVVQMVDAVPVAAHREQLLTVSDVKEWTAEELFSFIQSQNILPDEEDRAIFQKAQIDGDVFLQVGEADDYWLHRCQLPLGPSSKLVLFVKEIKGVGEEQLQGNALLCFSDVAGSV